MEAISKLICNTRLVTPAAESRLSFPRDSEINFVAALGRPNVHANWHVLVIISSTAIIPISVLVIRRVIKAKATIPISALIEVSKTRKDAPLTILTVESPTIRCTLTNYIP